MSDRLTDEQVDYYAVNRCDYYPPTEVQALAREVQEWRQMRCETCQWWGMTDPERDPDWHDDHRCHLVARATNPDWSCADWKAQDE